MREQLRGRQRVTRIAAMTALAVGLGAAAAVAGPAYVVKDLIDGSEPGASSDPGPFFDLGHTTLFFARDEVHGRELWRTDGTAAGTVLVKDALPGAADGVASRPISGAAVADGVLYFRGQDALWRSDGTAAGTSRLASVAPWSMIVDGNRLYAAVDFDDDGFRLVRVDLPGGATTTLGEFRGGAIHPSLTLVAGRLFFAAASGREGLWTSDGTPEGTRLVRAVRLANREGGNGETTLIAAGGLLFLAAYDDGGWEVWRSDGSEAGTYRVRDIDPGPGSGIHFDDYSETAQPFFAVFGDTLLFMADDGASGLEPWRSDGTEAGTVRVADVWPGPRGVDGTESDADQSDVAGRVVRWVSFDGRLFFTAYSGQGIFELWVTGGTPDTTARVAPIEAGGYPVRAAAADATRIYIGGYDWLWASDGTEAGSRAVARLDQMTWLTAAGEGVIFSARDDLGAEPWVSDGTPAGTRRLADIARGLPGLDPQHLTDLDGTLLFSADDGKHGRELWRSDGTAAGTRLVADIAAGSAASQPIELVASGPTLYFVADDGGGPALWRSDGSAAGTGRAGGPAEPIGLAADGRGGVYFFAAEPNRSAFWHSDGTPAGTRLLRAGDGEQWIYDQPIAALGDLAVVVLRTPEAGHMLWRTDGTAAGTVPLVDLASNWAWVLASPPVRSGGAVHFFANYAGRAVLWRSDGSAGGTAAVRTLSGQVYDVTAGDDGRIYFNVGDERGYQLWQSDGTAEGTFALSPGAHANRVEIAAAGERAFTIAMKARRALFGEPGCVDLAETADAFGSLAGFGDRLLFAEPQASGAQRLWTSDGTRAGTIAIAELAPAAVPVAGAPVRFVRSGARVFFAARHGDSGTELWALPLAALPTVRAGACEQPPTPTPVPGRTPRPFACPDGGPCTVLEIAPVSGRAGDRVTVEAVLHARDLPVAGVQNDLALPAGVLVLEHDDGGPACAVEPRIGKGATAFAFQPPYCTPGEDCTAIRALVLAIDNVDPIDDGAVLYRCELLLTGDLEAGDYPLALANLGAADPDGGEVSLDGIDGVVTVEEQSGTRPVGGVAAHSANGCQTAAPGDLTAACLLLAAAIMSLLRRRPPFRRRSS